MPTLGTPIPIGVTTDEKNALQGTSGTPSDSNRFVTSADDAVNVSDATPSSIDPDDAGSAGTGSKPSREDHQHAITCDAPAQGIGGSNAEGDASTFARSNHDHLIRETDGPTDLSVGDIPDNYALIRSGSSVVGVNPYNPDRAIVVAKTALGADATSIADAITKANALSPAPSAAAPAVIVVHPGVYSTPPFTVPNYVSLVGVGGPEAVIFEASTTTAAICTANGGTVIQGITFKGANGSGGIGVDVGGTLAALHLRGIYVEDCETGIRCSGASKELHVLQSEIEDATNGLLADAGGTVRIDDLCIKLATYGLRLGSSNATVKGTGLRVVTHAGETYHVWVEGSASTLTLIGAEYREDRVSYNASSDIDTAHMTLVPGDEAWQINAELHVGSESSPRESAFGGGDSHVRGMAALRNTSLEAGTWSNITTALATLDASSADLFPGTGIGNAFYIGGDYPFPGIKPKITTARSGGVLVAEYWNGSAWVAFNHLSADSVSPYAQYAQDIFLRVSNEQVRFSPFTSWATKNLNGITKYWVRFRVTTALTTSPAADLCKLHTDRTEINSDGVVEHFGAAEPQRQIIWHRRLMEEMEGFAQADLDVDIAASPVLSIKGLSNRWQDGVKDGSVEIVHAPPGLDTSRPLIFQVGWYKTAIGTGNVELQADVVLLNEGDVVDGTLPYAQQLSQIVAVGARSALELIITEFQISLPDLAQNGSLALALYRDAGGGNLDDTYGGDCVHIFSRLYGTFWR